MVFHGSQESSGSGKRPDHKGLVTAQKLKTRFLFHETGNKTGPRFPDSPGCAPAVISGTSSVNAPLRGTNPVSPRNTPQCALEIR